VGSVTTTEDYRHHARECLDWAITAESQKEREIFEQMVVTWFEAAMLLEACRNDDPQTELLAAKLMS
jgi:hypothetical protein